MEGAGIAGSSVMLQETVFVKQEIYSSEEDETGSVRDLVVKIEPEQDDQVTVEVLVEPDCLLLPEEFESRDPLAHTSTSCQQTIAHAKQHTKAPTLGAPIAPPYDPAKPYRCDTCNKTFAKENYLQKHQLIHTGIRPFACDVCPKKFTQLKHLYSHKLNHSGKRYTCELCNREFKKVSVLKRHQQYVHTGEKPYSCDVCDKKFTKQGDLSAHQRIHLNIKPFSCQICNRSFVQVGTLIGHQRTHTGEKPFQCDVCLRGFSQSSALKSHKRIHTGLKPFHCDTCGKHFRQSTDLTTHMRSHTGEKPHECNVCPKRFVTKAHLTRHKKIHSKDTEKMKKPKLQTEDSKGSDQSGG